MNERKLPMHLITPEMLEALAKGLDCGVRKGYDERSWEKGENFDIEKNIGSVLRHLTSHMKGITYNFEKDKNDEYFITPHLVNAFIRLGMAITLLSREGKL